MLAVLGLKPEALEAIVAGTNKKLKLDAASGMTVSLGRFCCVWQPEIALCARFCDREGVGLAR